MKLISRGKDQLARIADLGSARLPKLRRRQATMVAIKMAVLETFHQSRRRLLDATEEKLATEVSENQPVQNAR